MLLKLAAFCYGPPISAGLAVCLDGPILNVYIIQAFSVKRIAPAPGIEPGLPDPQTTMLTTTLRPILKK